MGRFRAGVRGRSSIRCDPDNHIVLIKAVGVGYFKVNVKGVIKWLL